MDVPWPELSREALGEGAQAGLGGMVQSDEYRAIALHRKAALEDSRLIAMEEL
jgi:hypothetical protein